MSRSASSLTGEAPERDASCSLDAARQSSCWNGAIGKARRFSYPLARRSEVTASAEADAIAKYYEHSAQETMRRASSFATCGRRLAEPRRMRCCSCRRRSDEDMRADGSLACCSTSYRSSLHGRGPHSALARSWGEASSAQRHHEMRAWKIHNLLDVHCGHTLEASCEKKLAAAVRCDQLSASNGRGGHGPSMGHDEKEEGWFAEQTNFESKDESPSGLSFSCADSEAKFRCCTDQYSCPRLDTWSKSGAETPDSNASKRQSPMGSSLPDIHGSAIEMLLFELVEARHALNRERGENKVLRALNEQTHEAMKSKAAERLAAEIEISELRQKNTGLVLETKLARPRVESLEQLGNEVVRLECELAAVKRSAAEHQSFSRTTPAAAAEGTACKAVQCALARKLDVKVPAPRFCDEQLCQAEESARMAGAELEQVKVREASSRAPLRRVLGELRRTESELTAARIAVAQWQHALAQERERVASVQATANAVIARNTAQLGELRRERDEFKRLACTAGAFEEEAITVAELALDELDQTVRLTMLPLL